MRTGFLRQGVQGRFCRRLSEAIDRSHLWLEQTPEGPTMLIGIVGPSGFSP